jgi:hypothetical protein
MRVDLTSNHVEIQLTLMEKFAALCPSNPVISLSDISTVRIAPPEVTNWLLGFRVGTHFPGQFVFGYFYHWSDPTDFYAFNGNVESTICIELKSGSKLGKVYLTVSLQQLAEYGTARKFADIIMAAVSRVNG